MINKKVFPALAVPVFSAMLGVGIIVPLLPLYAHSLGASALWLGLIMAAFSISRTILTPLVGRLSDQRGRKFFICLGLGIYTAVSLGYPWAHTTWQLILIRLIQGSAAGMIVPIAQAYVGDISPPGEEGKWTGYFNAAFFSGFGVGPFIGGVLNGHFGMDAAFYTMAGVNLAAFLVAFSLLPEIKPQRVRLNPSISLRRIGLSNILKGVFSFRLAYAIGRGAFATFLPLFAVQRMNLSSSLIGVVMGVNIILMSSLLPAMGKVADRLSRRTLVIIGALASAAFVALIPLTHSFGQLLGLCFLGSVGGATCMPAASALTIDEGRRFGMGLSMGLFNMAMSLGMVIGPLGAGMVVQQLGLTSAFYSAAIIGLVGCSLFAWFTRT